MPSDMLEVKMSSDITVPSQMPALDKSLPPENLCIPELEKDQPYIDYLQVLKHGVSDFSTDLSLEKLLRTYCFEEEASKIIL